MTFFWQRKGIYWASNRHLVGRVEEVQGTRVGKFMTMSDQKRDIP